MTDFKTVFIKKLSQKKWDMFEKTIRSLMKDAVADYKGDMRCILHTFREAPGTIRPNVNDADYSQAFGMLQGIAYYALGYKWLGGDNEEGTPKQWIRTIEAEIGEKAYAHGLAKAFK